MFESVYLPFEEDHLPPGQEPIETRSVKQLATLARLLTSSRERTGYSAMAVVTGPPGVGKSIAVQAFLRNLGKQSHTQLPSCIDIHVKTDSTPKAFVEDLLLRLEAQRAPRLETTRYRLTDRAAELIVSHDIRLIFVDEAEQLNVGGFEFLRYIFGKTGCPIILVGDERIVSMLGRQLKFSSRSGLYQDFLPPSDEEVLDVVLPQLHFPGWVFDPTQPGNRAMGKDLWFRANKSFRNLRLILQFASSILPLDEGLHQITPDFLQIQVYPLLGLTRPSPHAKAAPQGSQQPSAYDIESQQRHAARTRRKKKGQASA
jgi:hypothetical protein